MQTQIINVQQLPLGKQKLIQKNQNKKKNQKQQQIIYKNLNPFKQQQKFYKYYQDKQTDFSQLFNPQQNAKKFQILGYTVYQLPAPQNGAYLIKGFNSPQIVNQIGYLALNQFWRKPYRTNLNSRNELYEKQQQQNSVLQKYQNLKQQQFNALQQYTTEQFQQQIKQKGYCFNDKIRWANVGHQYDWTLRKYPEYHTPMHQKIKALTDQANQVFNKLLGENNQYYPQSAIVNYYGQKDYMTGHLDDAEYDQQSPIYSFSFGLSCVFLMGARTKDEKPLSVRLNTGDLLIMSKDSRKCYHGVPRVIANSYLPVNKYNNIKKQGINNNSPLNVQKYFEGHRININIRQVFPQKK